MTDAYIPWELRDGWRDIKPIPQAETSDPLVPINYSQEYANAMCAFRYIISINELSRRVLDLTREIVMLNPAHYTVWSYRSKTLLALQTCEDNGNELLVQELDLLSGLVKQHLKNYQVWQHRKIIVTALNDPSREVAFTTLSLGFDAKNYHTWAYRQWALSHFYPDSITDALIWQAELEYVNELLESDVRNNSAWNHRWFTVFAREIPTSEAVVKREIDFAKAQLAQVPNNASAWNYLRGILDRNSLPYVAHLDWARALRSTVDENARIVLALEFVADAMVASSASHSDTVNVFESLKQADPMRTGYWEWRKAQIVSVV